MPFPEPIEADEVRGKPEKFAEHFNQARLFYASQTPTEQAHIQGAYRFELSKVTVPAVRARVVSMLRNVSDDLAIKLAGDLGMELPPAMPPVLARAPTPEVSSSPPLSMTTFPGTVGIQARKVAIWVADGVNADQVNRAFSMLRSGGANPRLIGPRIGAFTADGGDMVEAVGSLETEPAVTFDGLVVPAGNDDFFATFIADGRALEFCKDLYRHCKTMLLVGNAGDLLDAVGVPDGEQQRAGIVLGQKANAAELATFSDALALHKHFSRESDPPVA